MKIVKIFGICFFSMLCLVGITQRANAKNNLSFGIVCGIIAFLLFLSVRHSNKKQREKSAQQAAIAAQQNALAEIKADGTLSEISVKYFGEDYVPKN